MTRPRICVTIPDELLRAADTRAAVESRSRSWVITEAVAAFTAPPAPDPAPGGAAPAGVGEASWVAAFERYSDYREWMRRDPSPHLLAAFRERLARLCTALAYHGARYAVVGTAGLRLLGASRTNEGVELLIPHSKKNTRRVLGALVALGAPLASEALAEGLVAREVTVFGDAPRADLLMTAGPLRYRDVKKRASGVNIEGVQVRVAAIGDVIETIR